MKKYFKWLFYNWFGLSNKKSTTLIQCDSLSCSRACMHDTCGKIHVCDYGDDIVVGVINISKCTLQCDTTFPWCHHQRHFWISHSLNYCDGLRRHISIIILKQSLLTKKKSIIHVRSFIPEKYKKSISAQFYSYIKFFLLHENKKKINVVINGMKAIINVNQIIRI